MSLKKKVKTLREKLEMNQADLAKASDITHATISRIESGQIKELKSGALKRLAKALGVSADYLIGSHKSLKREALNNPDVEYLVNEYQKMSFKTREQLKDYVRFLAHREQNEQFYEEETKDE